MVFAVPEALAETCSGSQKVPYLADLKWKWKVGQYRLVFTDGQIKSAAGMGGDTISKLRDLAKRRVPQWRATRKKNELVGIMAAGIGPARIGPARGWAGWDSTPRKAPIKRSRKETVDGGPHRGKQPCRWRACGESPSEDGPYGER